MRRLLESHKGLKQVSVTDSDSINMVAPEDLMRMVIRERAIIRARAISYVGDNASIIVLLIDYLIIDEIDIVAENNDEGNN